MKKIRVAAGLILAVALTASVPSAPSFAANGRACFESCKTRLQKAGLWNKYPRGYCRQECNYYADAPTDVLKKAGRKVTSAQACLESCRAKMRAIPGFQQNPANRRYCKDKCGVP